MASGAIIALIPDERYITSTEKPHCTLAYFGRADQLEEWQKTVLRNVTRDLAQIRATYAKSPEVTGRALFTLDPPDDKGNTVAYVDLVDWNVMPRFRSVIEERAGFSLNRERGFIPHITKEFADQFIPDLARPAARSRFGWRSVELWLGDEHEQHDLTHF